MHNALFWIIKANKHFLGTSKQTCVSCSSKFETLSAQHSWPIKGTRANQKSEASIINGFSNATERMSLDSTRSALPPPHLNCNFRFVNLRRSKVFVTKQAITSPLEMIYSRPSVSADSSMLTLLSIQCCLI